MLPRTRETRYEMCQVIRVARIAILFVVGQHRPFLGKLMLNKENGSGYLFLGLTICGVNVSGDWRTRDERNVA